MAPGFGVALSLGHVYAMCDSVKWVVPPPKIIIIKSVLKRRVRGKQVP